MRVNTTPSQPRHLSRCGGGTAPGRDARWRNVPKKVRVASPVHVLNIHRAKRDTGNGKEA